VSALLVAYTVVFGLVGLVLVAVVATAIACLLVPCIKKTLSAKLQTVHGLPRQTRAFQTMNDEEDPDGPGGEGL
jgi:hypothetical protein